jgi:hypothetical protein
MILSVSAFLQMSKLVAGVGVSEAGPIIASIEHVSETTPNVAGCAVRAWKANHKHTV